MNSETMIREMLEMDRARLRTLLSRQSSATLQKLKKVMKAGALKSAREACLANERRFAEDACGITWCDSPYHREMYDIMQFHPPLFGLFVGARDHIKTTNITVADTAWRLTWNPDLSVLLGHFYDHLARKYMMAIVSTMRRPRYRELFPEVSFAKVSEKEGFILGNRTRSDNNFSCWTTSAKKSEVSTHPDIIKLDDLTNDLNMDKPDAILETRDIVRSCIDLLSKHPKAFLWVIANRWGTYDTAGWILEDMARTINGKMINETGTFDCFVRGLVEPCTKEENQTKYAEEWIGKPYAKYIYPNVMNDTLIERRYLQNKMYDKYRFSCLMLCAPANNEKEKIKAEWFKPLYFTDKDLPADLDVSIFIDPAVSASKTSIDNDATACVVIGVDINDCWWILEATEHMTNPNELLDLPIDKHIEYQSRFGSCNVFIESEGCAKLMGDWDSGGALRDRMELRSHSFSFETYLARRVPNAKEKKILGLGPRIQSAKFRLKKEHIKLELQIVKVGSDGCSRVRKSDDLADACATGIEKCYKKSKTADTNEIDRYIENKTAKIKWLARLQGKEAVIDYNALVTEAYAAFGSQN